MKVVCFDGDIGARGGGVGVMDGRRLAQRRACRMEDTRTRFMHVNPPLPAGRLHQLIYQRNHKTSAYDNNIQDLDLTTLRTSRL